MEYYILYVFGHPEWISIIITAVGLYFVYGQLKASQHQLTLSNYSEYTRRYSELVALFPEDVHKPVFLLSGRDDHDAIMRAMRRYFDLCFEEYDLFKKDFIAEDIWQLWKNGISTALGKPAFQQAWEIIKNDSQFGDGFENLIANMKVEKII